MTKDEIEKLPTPETYSLEYKHFNVLADEIISGKREVSLSALYRELQTKCRSVEQRLAAAVVLLERKKVEGFLDLREQETLAAIKELSS